MSKLDEKEIITIMQKSFANERFVSEDVETINFKGMQFVISTDTFVESTDMPKSMSLESAVRKSIVACVSDFAAKGVLPKFGIISLTIPKRFSKKQILKIGLALSKTSKEFKFRFIGGDTNAGKELVIQVTLIGFTKSIVKRSGANVGDRIFVTGPFGYTGSGIKIILEKKKASTRFLAKAKNSVYFPHTHLNFAIKSSKYFSSAMDSSDGLAATLNEMARQSKKKFILNTIPAQKDVFEFAKINNIDPMNLIFNAGEEYEIVFTAKNKKSVLSNAKKYGLFVYEIGYVSRGAGVIYDDMGKKKVIKDVGWIHFKKPISNNG